MPKPIIREPRPVNFDVTMTGQTIVMEFLGKRLNQPLTVNISCVNNGGDEIYPVENDSIIQETRGNRIRITFVVPEYLAKEGDLTGAELEVTVTNDDGESDSTTYP